jgi:hypothetical protein
MFSRPIDVSKYALVYAGAQKNLAPAGTTLVILREDMLARSPKTLPTMLDYAVHAKEKSLYNTPAVFAIYIMRLVMKWVLSEGGLEAMARQNGEKAKLLYARSTDPAASPAARKAGQPLEHERCLPAPPGAGGEVRRGSEEAAWTASRDIARSAASVSIYTFPKKASRLVFKKDFRNNG